VKIMMKNKLKCLGIFILLVMTMTIVTAVPPKTTRPHIVDFSDETRFAFRPLLSILIDKETIDLGESATFTINLVTDIDNDYSDGTYEVQWGGWLFTDKDGNIINSQEFERVYGSFSDTVTVKPTEVGEYALVGVILYREQTYDSVTRNWTTGPEEIKVKEAKKLTVETTEPPPPPTPGIVAWFTDLMSRAWVWFTGLFG